jgi:outer membrane protein
MKLFRLSLSIIALLAASATASAQQMATPTAAPPQGAATGLSTGKVAVINTTLFQEQLGEFKLKVEGLNRQFETRVKDVQSLADRIGSLENTLKTQSNVLTPARVAEMTEQVATMKREYQRKGEDLQAEGNRAREQAFAPLSEKLAKFAQEYSAKRGIVVMIDLANAINSNTVLWYDRRTDVTQDFINEYNKAHPVPGAAAPAPAKPAGQKP